MDTVFLHLLSHRPKEALERLRSMAAGAALQIEDGESAALHCTCTVHSSLQHNLCEGLVSVRYTVPAYMGTI